MSKLEAELAKVFQNLADHKASIEMLTNQMTDMNLNMDRIHLSILIDDVKSKLNVQYLPPLQTIRENQDLIQITETNLNHFKDMKFNRNLVSFFLTEKN